MNILWQRKITAKNTFYHSLVIFYQTATNKSFFRKPSKKNAIIGDRSKPLDWTGKLDLIGPSIDSVIVYNRIVYWPRESCGIQLRNALTTINICRMEKTLLIINLRKNPINSSTFHKYY
jgi:hypothetical protein